MKEGFVYILTNKNKTVLYVGATGNLKNRVKEHISGKGSVFTRKYKSYYLVYFEKIAKYEDAFKREKQIKNWKNEWKWNLIKSKNPDLKNLYLDLLE
ncbi:GIY-YIG nuclease family protein [Seonamhaeicola marinus]|uniref:GIY-YIG nuclease family protein n=2 Tax=Seonamhaeicola marinus TaxID=1912246 RepID=A0A5D0HIS3_9FLAO|nr:GIY-YIG nuclease family protein [Seonamhaeicola marinus]TYA69957.1 GIY-YIG nuclease family protein [Seonamhaeicola marinus]